MVNGSKSFAHAVLGFSSALPPLVILGHSFLRILIRGSCYHLLFTIYHLPRLSDVPCHKPESVFPWIHACKSAWLKAAHVPTVPVCRAGRRRYRASVLQTSGAAHVD